VSVIVQIKSADASTPSGIASAVKVVVDVEAALIVQVYELVPLCVHV
jgi:hypothetical protein